jgi:hypothetical protein
MNNTFDWSHVDSCIKAGNINRALGLMLEAFGRIASHKEVKRLLIKRIYDIGYKLERGVIKEKYDGILDT